MLALNIVDIWLVYLAIILSVDSLFRILLHQVVNKNVVKVPYFNSANLLLALQLA